MPEITSRKEYHLVIDFIVVTTLVIFSLYWACKMLMTSPPYVDPERYPIRGIDVSVHNGMMNMDAVVKDGIEFIFIKASEGVSMKDENFRINYDKARHAGLKIGAYHFFRFDKDGVEQALNILDAIGKRKLDLGIAIDIERTGNPTNIPDTLVTQRVNAMVDYLNLRGYRVMFYSNKDGYYDFIKSYFRGLPLWICSFSSSPIMTDWIFWQHNHKGKVNGIKGPVDLNVFGGSRKDWEDYLKITEVNN